MGLNEGLGLGWLPTGTQLVKRSCSCDRVELYYCCGWMRMGVWVAIREYARLCVPDVDHGAMSMCSSFR